MKKKHPKVMSGPLVAQVRLHRLKTFRARHASPRLETLSEASTFGGHTAIRRPPSSSGSSVKAMPPLPRLPSDTSLGSHVDLSVFSAALDLDIEDDDLESQILLQRLINSHDDGAW
eukprot:CAMPEP_0197517596 /NCGR_PEP_ID=MMETSP1318-20131121/2635_1 /TAXON_ID=552666 /ORGANISM="Partenskyella glossopodia, Strain RCC365" /LENGTH=115 /DNA_ID=CAMNT_0043067285 /DNA_START=6 /DNA_END=350 /DNA_ORIENTATION=-